MDKRWLTTREAAVYASISRDRLKRICQKGLIKGCPDPDNRRGDWIFDRLSIDAYRESQMTQATAREKALAIIKGVQL